MRCPLQYLHIYRFEMHSASSRFNSITLYTCLVLAVMSAINFTHGYLIYNPKVDVEFKLKDPTNFVDAKNWEQAAFKFDLRADLSTLYTWNLKQLYVFLEFEWTDPHSGLNSRMIASDWILETPGDKSKLKEAWTLNLTDTRVEYLVRDVYRHLRGTTVKVSLNVEYMPIVGAFFKTRLYETTYVMPSEYTNASAK